MTRILVVMLVAIMSVSCATNERISEYQACKARSFVNYPVNLVPQNYTDIEYFQRQEGMTCSRIPAGFYNAGGMECTPNMRTYWRTVEKTRQIDANRKARSNWTEACANQQCVTKFGNADCK